MLTVEGELKSGQATNSSSCSDTSFPTQRFIRASEPDLNAAHLAGSAPLAEALQPNGPVLPLRSTYLHCLPLWHLRVQTFKRISECGACHFDIKHVWAHWLSTPCKSLFSLGSQTSKVHCCQLSYESLFCIILVFEQLE